MTPDLDLLEALAKAATPGPWYFGHDDDDNAMSRYTVLAKPQEGRSVPDDAAIAATLLQARPFLGRWRDNGFGEPDGLWEENAAYIAAANPEAVLALIADARRYRHHVARCARCGGEGPEVMECCDRCLVAVDGEGV